MTIDGLVVARGAAAGVLLAVPSALANVILADQDDRSTLLSLLTLLGLVLGFAVAGFVAGRLADHDAARHGTAAALLVFVLVQVIAVLGRLDRGDDISLFSILFTGFLAAAAGSFAGARGARRPDRPTPP